MISCATHDFMSSRKEIAASRLRQARSEAGYDSARAAAEAFGFTTSTLTSHENGTREFDVETAIRYGKAFKVNPGSLLALDHVEPMTMRNVLSTTTIPYLGKVAAGLWLDSTFGETQPPEYVTIDRFAGDVDGELFAVTPEGPSMNLTIPAHSTLICRRVAYGLDGAVPGDLVVVERINHDLREMTCKRLAMDGDEYILLSESDRPEFKEPIRLGRPDETLHIDDEITVIGVVLRAIQDLRRRN